MKLFEKFSKKDNQNETKKPYIKSEGINKEADYREERIYKSLDKTLVRIQEMLGHTAEFKKRDFYLDFDRKIKVAFLYMNGIVDQTYINDTIMDNLVNNYERFKDKIDLTNFDNYHNYLLTVTEMSQATTFGELISGILAGDTPFLIDGFDKFFVIGTRKFPERSVSEPTTQIAVVGPRDSFTESILTNLNLIRRRIKSPNLWLEKFLVGTDSNTDIIMLYLKGIAEDSLVREVYDKIKGINIEHIIDSSYVEAMIKEKKFSIFPVVYTTERPDIAAVNLFEGKVVILVDGSPFVAIVPTVFIQLFHSIEDYYQKAYVSTFFRFLRMGAFYISLLLPALYVSLVGLHAELLPFQLLVRISGQREGLPFPSYAEAILMSLLFDILREAGVRSPTSLGTAITTAGALILGQSAVEAGIVSPIMVVIISVTAISTLIIPNYRLQLKVVVLKYLFILINLFFGIFGLTLALIVFYTHLCSLRSFGVNYYTPFAPFNKSGQKDSIVKAPLKDIFTRPGNFVKRNK